MIGTKAIDDDVPTPKRVWNLPSHNAEKGGTRILSKLIPGRHFPYPKSLYAVEDILRFFLAETPDAVVLDFFRRIRHDGPCRYAPESARSRVAPVHQCHEQRSFPE